MKNKKVVRIFSGIVTSRKMNDTIVVLIERKVKHSKYGKFIRRFKKLHVHCQGNKCQKGDVAIVRETRPISKTKSWVLVKVEKMLVKDV
ncbi:30S ribosomal protein S17 [Coxiella endosymbiont of Amblyomma americanum]|uniref:30S ribosomal protein S17 n=1 Tax=Coxiella-like endosymbiont of Amblyomma americanum TaxID=1987500 RepID=UPI00057DBD28|nr:30S ribosomal protein S17 [Coxiella endosymbiont of Amblyomma americanum]AJC50432.1 30S ribosomal protein S17 [Coxiella endosymbiont of Amblyomma americanum]AUJ58772.1 30S ribosomal protein S17 [Coxiella-like endosymbiont of Amblyomma americanum]